MRLDNENVRAANGLVKTTVDLAIREFADIGLSEFYAQLLSDVLGEFGVTAARDEDEATLSE